MPTLGDAIAPTSFNCHGTVYSSRGGILSGVTVRLYGYQTGGGPVPESRVLESGIEMIISQGTGSWVRLDTAYSSGNGYYEVSSSNTADKTKMKIVFSKSGYYSKTIYYYTNKGSYHRDVTLICPPPAPTGLVWYEEGVIDIAFNTPEAFVTWDVDQTPYQGFLEVANNGDILETISLTGEQLTNHYMIYSCPFGSDFYEFRLKMRNYDATYNVYSSYAYTNWKTVQLIDSNSFFAIGGYRYAYVDTWVHSSLPDVKASMSMVMSFEEVTVGNINYLDVSVAAYFYSCGIKCLLPNGLRVRLTNGNGIEHSETLKGEQDIYMKAYNYEGTDLDPYIENTGSIIPIDPSDPTKWLAALGYIITGGNLYYGVTNIGLTIWGAVGLGMNVAKFFWFDLPNANSDYAAGAGAHCQTTYNTEGSLTALNRPYEVVTISKFRVRPTGSIYDMDFDVQVDSNLSAGYLWNGEMGMYWSYDAYLLNCIDVYF